jgi:hypothetical protein
MPMPKALAFLHSQQLLDVTLQQCQSQKESITLIKEKMISCCKATIRKHKPIELREPVWPYNLAGQSAILNKIARSKSFESVFLKKLRFENVQKICIFKSYD